MHFHGTALRGFALVVLLAGVVAAQKQETSTSALINQALDKTVNLKLDGVLPDVLRAIDEKTGVRIEATDQAYQLLPWGEQTNIKATIENQTLRSALQAIARKLGLVYELGQYEVWLKPMPALARLGRRATLSEIAILDLTRTTPLDVHQEKLTIQALLDAIDKQLAKIKKPTVALEVRAGDPTDPQAGFIQLDKPINVTRGSSIAKALEDLANQSNATWYPWGNNIVVVPKQQQIRMQLEKTITARFNGMDISKVLDRLQTAAGVPFHIEPGAYQRVPPQYRSIRLDLENATIRQVLDDIRGVTGLDYVVKPDGVYIWNQNATPAIGAVGPADPVVAIIRTETGLEVLLRESEISPEARAYIAQKKQGALEQLQKQMKAEGFVSPTQPSTQPAQ